MSEVRLDQTLPAFADRDLVVFKRFVGDGESRTKLAEFELNLPNLSPSATLLLRLERKSESRNYVQSVRDAATALRDGLYTAAEFLDRKYDSSEY